MKIVKLTIVLMSLTLTACGGGSGSADGSSNNVEGDDTQPATLQSFTTMTKTLINADENSEPLDIMAINLDTDADDDETAFVDLMPLEN